LSFQTLEDIMPLESEYFPPQTSRQSSLSPEERGTYKKIAWGLFGFYAAAIVIMGVVVVGNAGFQKADVIEIARTLPPQQGAARTTNVRLQPSPDRPR
jgi:hypothetical protein